MFLVLTRYCEYSYTNPVQSLQTVTVDPNKSLFNQTCITENLENRTVIISANVITSQDPNQQSPTAQFNERRRDMFFEDYSIKQIEVIDTSVV